MGDINSDMSSRRGRVLGMKSAGGDLQTVEVEVPLAEVTTYARSLSSITGGQGSYTMEFSHYDVVPGNILQQIIAKAQMKEEEETMSMSVVLGKAMARLAVTQATLGLLMAASGKN